MEYKNQHCVTEAYLRAWCDPQTPNGAFVWVISKADRKITKRSPKSLFSETDFYTVHDSNGDRVLRLEHKLQEVEDKFILLREKKLRRHQQLTEEDRMTLALFVATTYARTKRQKEEGIQIWREYIDFIASLPNELSSRIKQTREYRDVEDLHIKQPMLFHLFNFVNITAPYLFLLNCAIYETNTSPGLITSDNPCFWFDPAVYDPHIPLTFFGVGSPTLNIFLPISPNQYSSLKRNGPDGYIDLHTNPDAELEMIDLINGFTATNCEGFIVVSRKEYKERWFDESVP